MNANFKRRATKAGQLFRREARGALFHLHGLLHDEVSIQTDQGRISMSTRDRGPAKRLFESGQHEFDFSLRAVRFLKQNEFLSGHGITMLDVGANIGHVGIGLILQKEVDSVIAIEPEPQNYELLVKNAKQNGLSNSMICLQMAAGESESLLGMELSPLNKGDHRIRSTPIASALQLQDESLRQTIQVPALPLTEILELPVVGEAKFSTPSLVWIDVQGYEGFVFKGAKDFLGSGIPTVSEVWPYGILRAGMSLDTFASIVSNIWSEYWIDRRERLIRYPTTVFDRYLEELGNDGYFENVIFTSPRRRRPSGDGPTSSP